MRTINHKQINNKLPLSEKNKLKKQRIKLMCKCISKHKLPTPAIKEFIYKTGYGKTTAYEYYHLAIPNVLNIYNQKDIQNIFS